MQQCFNLKEKTVNFVSKCFHHFKGSVSIITVPSQPFYNLYKKVSVHYTVFLFTKMFEFCTHFKIDFYATKIILFFFLKLWSQVYIETKSNGTFFVCNNILLPDKTKINYRTKLLNIYLKIYVQFQPIKVSELVAKFFFSTVRSHAFTAFVSAILGSAFC